MSKILHGAFFRMPIDSAGVISFLQDKYTLKTVESGPKNLRLEGVCDSRRGGHRQLVFSNIEDLSKTEKLTESLILIDEIPGEELSGTNQFCQISDPRAAFIDTLKWLTSSVGLDPHQYGFSQYASVSPNANVASSAVIEPSVEIGAGCLIGAGAVVKAGTRIGDNTVIRENTVIGSEGITVHVAADGRLVKFPHVGGVYVGSNTEIGANTVIAGGILAPTYIGNNVVIGNLCNVGHSVVIENSVWMSVGTLIGGHTTIHAGATIAMGVSIRDNMVIGEKASIGMGSVVVKCVESRHSMFGNPAKRIPGLKAGPKR